MELRNKFRVTELRNKFRVTGVNTDYLVVYQTR